MDDDFETSDGPHVSMCAMMVLITRWATTILVGAQGRVASYPDDSSYNGDPWSLANIFCFACFTAGII